MSMVYLEFWKAELNLKTVEIIVNGSRMSIQWTWLLTVYQFISLSVNSKAVTRGRTDYFSIIFLLWLWALIFDLDLHTWPRCQDEPACQTSRPEVIQFRSYCPNTQTHKHRSDCCTWTTKMVGNYCKDMIVWLLCTSPSACDPRTVVRSVRRSCRS